MLKTIELYILKWWIFWWVNCISVKKKINNKGEVTPDPTAQGQPQLLSIEQFTKCGLGARHLSPLFIYSSQWLYQSSVRPEPPDPSGALPSTSLCLFLQRILSEERACWFGVSLKYCFIELGALLTQLTKIYLWCGSVSTQHSSLKEVKNWRKGLNLWS